MEYPNIYALVDKLQEVVREHLALALAIMLLGGVLSSLSPSSVPRMVAIVNYAGREAKTLARAIALSLIFVAGICTVYGFLGAVAGSFGALLSTTGFLYYATAALCLLMGLVMIRLIDVRLELPTFRAVSHGLSGAYLLGLGFAMLIAPDAAPFMLGALAVSTFQGKLVLGVALMLVFGIGHGVPVLFAGALAPWYAKNPAVQKWHVAAEMAAGYILVFLALFFAVIA